MLAIMITGGGVEDRLEKALMYKTPESYIVDGQLKSITIDEVRDFQKQLNLAAPMRAEGPANGGRTVTHFILEAQNLTLPAQHTLLKSIEELQDRLRLVLTADKSSSLLATVISRCRIDHLIVNKPVLADDMKQKLQQLLRLIAISSYGELITIASQLNKNNPAQTLNDLLILLEESLKSKPNPRRLHSLRLTQTAISDLKSNVNSQLALEHYLVELKSLML